MRNTSNGAGMLALPFLIALTSIALIRLGVPVPLNVAMAAAAVSGFVFLERATGIHAAWLGIAYVPAMYWLVMTFTGVVAYLSGIGHR